MYHTPRKATTIKQKISVISETNGLTLHGVRSAESTVKNFTKEYLKI